MDVRRQRRLPGARGRAAGATLIRFGAAIQTGELGFGRCSGDARFHAPSHWPTRWVCGRGQRVWALLSEGASLSLLGHVEACAAECSDQLLDVRAPARLERDFHLGLAEAGLGEG